MKDRPNIALILCDQLRWDCFGYMSHPVVESPHIDQLAHEGIVFTNAYSSVPTCVAARASLLTGMKPKNHGRVGYQDGVPFTYNRTLSGELAKSGYHTQAIGKNHFYPARNLCGYHNCVLHDGYLHHERLGHLKPELADDYIKMLKDAKGSQADLILHGLNCNSWVARPWPYEEELHPTTWATSEAIDFLRRRDPTKPFFMKLSYVRPHPPLDPPKVYYDLYIHQEFPDVPVGEWADRKTKMKSVDGEKGIIDKKALHRARAAYYALITHIDHQIGRFIQYLKEYDVYDNTLIIFTSDHGELLGDHNLFRKAMPFNGSVRIPLLFSPGKKLKIEYLPAKIDEICELRDIMPTILDTADIDIAESVEGRSLLPLICDAKPAWREYLHGEHAYGEDSHQFIVTKKEKYIWFSRTGKEMLFDLTHDPNELLNTAEKNQKRCGFFRNLLVKELACREEGYVKNGELVTGRKEKTVLDSVLS